MADAQGPQPLAVPVAVLLRFAGAVCSLYVAKAAGRQRASVRDDTSTLLLRSVLTPLPAAGPPREGTESMLTFWPLTAVSELPAHVAALHMAALVVAVQPGSAAMRALASLRTALGHGGGGVSAASLSIHALNASVPLIVAAGLLPLVRLMASQLQVRGDCVRQLRAAGVPAILTNRTLSAIKLLACILPVPQVLSFGIECKAGIVYARALRRPRRRDEYLLNGERKSVDLEPSLVILPAAGRLHTTVETDVEHTIVRDGAVPAGAQWRNLKLDMYWHAASKRRPAPVLCYIHGGGWVTGHRSHHSLPLLYELAHQGWLVVTINYRLAPLAGFPHMLYDAKAAIIWLRHNVAAFGGDPSFICVAGESAGGHLASMVALTANVPAYQGSNKTDTSVAAVVDLYGVHNWSTYGGGSSAAVARFISKVVLRARADQTERFIRGSPHWWLAGADLPRLAHEAAARDASMPGALPSRPLDFSQLQDMCVDRRVPPTMLVHGQLDGLVPEDDSDRFWAALQARRRQAQEAGDGFGGGGVSASTPAPPAAAVPDCYLSMPYAHHAFNFIPSPRTFAVGDAIADWLVMVHERTMAARRAAVATAHMDALVDARL